jgi:hypothetical protein
LRRDFDDGNLDVDLLQLFAQSKVRLVKYGSTD